MEYLALVVVLSILIALVLMVKGTNTNDFSGRLRNFKTMEGRVLSKGWGAGRGQVMRVDNLHHAVLETPTGVKKIYVVDGNLYRKLQVGDQVTITVGRHPWWPGLWLVSVH